MSATIRLNLGAVLFMLLTTAQASLTGGYVHSSSTFLCYLRLTQTKGQLRGFIQTVEADPYSSSGSKAQTTNVKGEVEGSAFTLRGDSFLSGFTCEGTARKGKVELQFPLSNGQMKTLAFVPATEKTWNTKVQAFREKLADLAFARRWHDLVVSHVRDLQSVWQRETDRVKAVSGRIAAMDSEETERAKSVKNLKSQLPTAEGNLTDATKALEDATKKVEEAERADSENSTERTRRAVREANASEREASRLKDHAESSLDRLKDQIETGEGKLEDVRTNLKEERETLADARARLDLATVELTVFKDGNPKDQLAALVQGKLTFAKVVSGAKVYSSPRKEAVPAMILPTSTKVVVLKLKGDWIPFYSQTGVAWLKTAEVKLVSAK